MPLAGGCNVWTRGGNSKSEFRNSKQYRMFKDLKLTPRSDYSTFRSFDFVSDSEIRISSFATSGRRDSNPRPLEPHSSALPSCATARLRGHYPPPHFQLPKKFLAR